MTGARFVFAAVLAAFALALAGCGGDDNEGTTTATETTTTEETTTEETTTETSATGSKLIGSVASDDFVITLTTEDGTSVTSLPPGDYTLEIVDKSAIHNFHLTGPGVDVMSEVSEEEDEDYDITLQAGSYHFQCDPHASQMQGDFEVSG